MGTIFRLEDKREIGIESYAPPHWVNRIALPILLVILLGLPLVLYNLTFTEAKVFAIKIVPIQSPLKLDLKLEDQKYIINSGESIEENELIAINFNLDSIVSPISGTFHLTYSFSANQMVPVIYPRNDSVSIKGLLKTIDVTSVKEGQTIVIMIPDYPSKEFGHIKGVVGKISSFPLDGSYTFDVILPHGLVSSKDSTLRIYEPMQVEGEILIKKKRVLVQIIESLKLMK